MRRVLFGVLLAGATLALASPAHARQPPDTTAPPPTTTPPEGGATEPESGVTGGGTEGDQTPVVENFGGDEVIGVSESDVNCPAFENPLRTLHLDGTPVEADPLEPLLDSKVRLLGAVLVPIAVAVGVIFLLATFRLSIAGVYHSVVDAGRRTR